MNMATFLKILKDGFRGALMSFLPLVMSAFSGPGAWITAIGGAVSAVLGIIAGAVKGSSEGTSVWLKILNDSLYGILIGAQPILQSGLSDGTKATYVISGLLIMALGVLSNVLHDDYSSATGIMKIIKDLFISLTNALIPVLQAGATAGLSLGVILVGFGHTALSVAANTLEADIFGTENAPVVKPTP